jgi:predicted amidohydrolase YtcJ
MRRLALAALLVPLLAGCLGADGGVPAADLVLLGGRVWTGEVGAPWAEAVAIRAGTLVAVGSDGEASRFVGQGTRVLRLDGAFVMPGLRDNHAHVLEVAAALPADQVAAALRPAPFVETAAEEELRHEEDFATQLALLGSRALDASIDHDGRNLGPLSTYEECTETVSVESGTPPTRDELVERFRAAEDELARQGLTTVVEARLHDITHVAALLEMQERGLSKVRWHLRVVPGCFPLLDALGLDADSDGEWVRLIGAKLYSDGYLGAWMAALREPYADRPGWSGVLAYDADTLAYRVEEARSLGLSVGTHAIGDASVEQALDAYEAAGIRPEDRWTIEHAIVLGPDLVGRMAGTGVVASIQLSFATSDRELAPQRLGPGRLADAYAWQTLAQAGVPLAASSDFPSEVIDPFWGLQRAVTRQELDGSAPWFPEQALTVEQALRAMTWGQAFASKEEAVRGTLAVGKAADLVVTLDDPFTMAPSRLASSTVLLTVTNGQVAFEGSASYPPPRPWP